MTRATDKLDEIAANLADKSDDAQRLELVQRARRFKRSWVEMAEAIVHVRATRAYERWGYADLYAYCDQELQIKKATVDKLTGSFMAVRHHAPQVLERDGVAQPIPSVDSVDYFAKALRDTAREAQERDGRDGREPPPDEVFDDLRTAVFDDNENVIALRRRFNPILHPKPEGAEDLERLEKTRAATRRLENLLDSAPGVSEQTAAKVQRALDALHGELDDLIEAQRAHVA